MKMISRLFCKAAGLPADLRRNPPSIRLNRMRAAALLLALLANAGCIAQAGRGGDPVPSAPAAASEMPGTAAYPVPVTGTSGAPDATAAAYPAPETAEPAASGSRGYLTTPQELRAVAEKARAGIEPYHSAVADVMEHAARPWDFRLDAVTGCPSADEPEWIDDEKGVPRLYARALAYHLTGDEKYAAEVRAILERIMTEVETISLSQQQCRLNFSWGTPELVASADLIEDYWRGQQCKGPASAIHGDPALTSGPCKQLFQNWLVKNPYYLVSYSAERSTNNWGAAATNAAAYIADYLWDRPEVRMTARVGIDKRTTVDTAFSPAEAYARARKLALDRMNGLRVDLDSSEACDEFDGRQQSSRFPPVKSQITELGIIPDDARRDEYCNITVYSNHYQNYPQVHLGNNIQQCELMHRRGDDSCYQNVSQDEIIGFEFIGPNGKTYVTNLRSGRGSIERAIKAIIVDSGMEWRKDSALEVAYRYYATRHTLPGFEQWFEHLDRPAPCSQDICFGTLTHGFAPGEIPQDPPVVSPPN